MTPYTGGCQCGTVRYEINSSPILAYCCHCTDCQQQSSSAFGMSVWFPGSAFKLTSGSLKTWATYGDSGNKKSCTLCADCGTRVYHAFPSESDTFSIKGGSLDRVKDITPIAHIWTKSAQPWLKERLAAEHCFEIEPKDFEELIAEFNRQ